MNTRSILLLVNSSSWTSVWSSVLELTITDEGRATEENSSSYPMKNRSWSVSVHDLWSHFDQILGPSVQATTENSRPPWKKGLQFTFLVRLNQMGSSFQSHFSLGPEWPEWRGLSRGFCYYCWLDPLPCKLETSLSCSHCCLGGWMGALLVQVDCLCSVSVYLVTTKEK